MAISDKLAKIRKQAAGLNAKTDELNSTFDYIEENLSGSGVEFWWDDCFLEERGSQSEDERGDRVKERSYCMVGYTKIGDRWQLAVRRRAEVASGRDGYGEEIWDVVREEVPIPLSNAPRRIRILAAEILELFLDALSREIDRMAALVDAANAIVGAEDAHVDPDVRKLVATRQQQEKRKTQK